MVASPAGLEPATCGLEIRCCYPAELRGRDLKAFTQDRRCLPAARKPSMCAHFLVLIFPPPAKLRNFIQMTRPNVDASKTRPGARPARANSILERPMIKVCRLGH